MKSDLDILCVDDDVDIVNLLKFSLEMQGHTVAIATNLKDASALLEEKPYDLFIIDLGITDADGLQFCLAIREHNKHAPIIVYSDRAGDKEKKAAYEAGATIYITNPDGLETIQQIANAMRNSLRANRNATITDKSETIPSN